MCVYLRSRRSKPEAGTDVRVPACGPPPLGPLARLPGERLRDERQPDGCAVRRHRRFGSCHEVVGVDDDRAVSPGVADGGVQLVQRLEPDAFDAHVGILRVPRLMVWMTAYKDAAISSGRRMRNACRASARKRRSARTTSRTRESVVSFRNTLTSWVSSRSHARSDAGDSNVRPSTSVSPKYIRPSSGSWRASRSPRSSIERKKAVERARGALHNANTGIGATYPERGSVAKRGDCATGRGVQSANSRCFHLQRSRIAKRSSPGVRPIASDRSAAPLVRRGRTPIERQMCVS